MSKIVFEKIIKFLEEGRVSFELLEHEAVFTSEEAARIRGTNIKQGAKALIFIGDKKPIMIVVPGDKRVDTKLFKRLFSIKDLSFASPEMVEEYLEGVKIGAVHPLGSLHNIPVYMDIGLSKNEKIVFNAGLHDKSIRMYYKDYFRLVKPKFGKFTV